jgi:hypothetical protein
MLFFTVHALMLMIQVSISEANFEFTVRFYEFRITPLDYSVVNVRVVDLQPAVMMWNEL